MEYNFPSLAERCQSVFVDSICIIVLMFGAAALLDKVQDPPDWIRIVLFFGIWTVYEPLCTAYSCTVGQYLVGLRVRSLSNPEKRISLPFALIRYVVKAVLGWLAFITISMNTERRAIHDFAAGSVMVKVK